MATRSFIGIETDNGVRGIYCHFDGYPKGVGATLRESYTTAEAVSALIDLGDMSTLGKTLEECQAYGRDRGEKDTEARVYPNLDAFLTAAERVCAEWAYNFNTHSGKWEITEIQF